MKIDEFKNELSKLGLSLNNDRLEKLEIYKELLKEWNNKFNLTTIINDDDIYLKHFYDSLCIIKAVNFTTGALCDFGTGAGFPGMVIAIFFDNLKVTLMESNNKKVIFLNEVKNKLKLNNVNVICQRAEDYGKENREIFDFITCRAVSNLNIILELSSSMLKVDGLFIPMKSNIDEEFEKAKKNFDSLSYKLEKRIDYVLPIEESKRTILVFRKFKPTALKYPRNYNIIKKNSII